MRDIDMEEYIGKFEMPYIDCQNFKEKETIIIGNIISGARIGKNAYFSGYANIRFDDDDTYHWYPKISLLDGFVRNKSNAMVLNINCKNKYDKVFIYKSMIKDSGFYGILLYNTEFNLSLHIYNVEYDFSKLIITVGRAIENNILK